MFLGLHLLVTDPSTSPRTPLGRIVFGVLYGLGVFGAVLAARRDRRADVLRQAAVRAAPEPERAAHRSRGSRRSAPAAMLQRLRLDGPLGRGNLAHMACVDRVLRVDDRSRAGPMARTAATACRSGSRRARRTGRNACRRLLQLETTYCGDNSGWACNELGAPLRGRDDRAADRRSRAGYFSRACELRFQAGVREPARSGDGQQAPPRVFDLRLLLREGGLNLLDMPEPDLYARACEHGWTFACEQDAALRTEVAQPPTDPSRRAAWIGWAALADAWSRSSPLFSSRRATSRPPMRPCAIAAVRRRGRQASSRTRGFCPTDELLGFVEIPAGPFVMGSDPARRSARLRQRAMVGTPAQGTVDLPAFYIGRYEVTVAQFGAFVEATGHRVDDQTLRAPANHPVAMSRGPTRSPTAAGSSRR